MPGSLLDRYRAGEGVSVWVDLVELGTGVRSPEHLEDTRAVALETMRRVRYNVELVRERLLQLGYEFWAPGKAHVPPTADTPAILAEIEQLRGPIPLSLQAFYEVVGSVDFRQSPRQLAHPAAEELGAASELSVLGEEDPLVVRPVEELLRVLRDYAPTQVRRVRFDLAPDEFHKANRSGGESYHVWLPNAAADFQVEGMYGINESFVSYLRATCAGGGFRGRLDEPDDAPRARKLAPRVEVIGALARDLLAI